MLVIKIELHSAVTGAVTELGRTYIANVGGTHERGEYDVKVCRKNKLDYIAASKNPLRKGHVYDYPRNSYNVWRLVARALLSAFPEEKD